MDGSSIYFPAVDSNNIDIRYNQSLGMVVVGDRPARTQPGDRNGHCAAGYHGLRRWIALWAEWVLAYSSAMTCMILHVVWCLIIR